MDKQNSLFPSPLVVLLVVCPLFLATFFLFPISDTAVFSFGETALKWIPITDLSTNAYFPWRLNPFLLILSYFGGYKTYCLLSLIVFLFGWYQLGRFLKTEPFSLHISSLLIPTILLSSFGVNATILSFVSALPWLLWIIFKSLEGSTSLIQLFFIGIFISFSVNQLGILLALWGAVFLLVSSPKKNHRGNLYVAFVILALLGVQAFLAPSLPGPQYPQDAHLVPGYGTPFGIDPIISYGSRKPFIDREFIRTFLGLPAIIAIMFSLFSFVIAKRHWVKSISMMTLISSLCLLLESKLIPTGVELISPLQALSRITPGLLAFPVSLYLFALTTCSFGFLVLIESKGSIGNILTYCALLTLMGTSLIYNRQDDYFLGTLYHQNSFGAQTKLINSPSLYLLRHNPSALMTTPLTNSITKTLFELGATATASHNSGKIDSLANNRKRDRWSTGLGKQIGTEWIRIDFAKPITLSGIDMSLPRFSSDFPRGIEVIVDNKCELNNTPIFHTARWLGSTAFSEDGYPYYTPESVITIPFNQSITTTCILIKQIGTIVGFDWTVEEMRIAGSF